jgi:hypothetical protein
MSYTDKDRETFENQVADILHQRHLWRWRILWIWMIVFTLATGYALRKGREIDNHLRATQIQIQKDRVSSCKRTYGGFELTIEKIFPRVKDKVKEHGREVFIAKVHKVVVGLQAGCAKQTGVKNGG